eukprot:TRINITY_DN22153_c0_g3_i1.p1 TRINITY_DN22153_c0_g3~~TRINITY_DN22153_c0_g3_i1.p1  ORF type:complete len:342 (+),score=91.19 TRINITY_DN22153_c0_g3_i1:70-1026(+)
MPRLLFLSISLLVAKASAEWPQLCVEGAIAYSSTRCDANSTCCDAGFSVSGKGCCPWQDATCCPGGYMCCPSGTKCVPLNGTSYNEVFTCTDIASGVSQGTSKAVCKPGPPLPFATTVKNILILGDSVSIGYTPVVANEMADVALVQHTPWDTTDGGAEETAYGVQCLKYFVRSPSGDVLNPDILMFNFGLHDGPLGNATVPGQQGNTSVYKGQLDTIAGELKTLLPNTQLLFALTTPMMCNMAADYNVQELNNMAADVMASHNIPTVDLHTPIVNKCGPIPVSSCFGVQNCFCPHCPGAGYAFIANSTIVPKLRSML